MKELLEIDLFEYYEQQPPELAKITERWGERQATEGLSYKELQTYLKEVQEVGYTFDSYLDAEPYNLRPLKKES